jgi:hypothetical protein
MTVINKLLVMKPYAISTYVKYLYLETNSYNKTTLLDRRNVTGHRTKIMRNDDRSSGNQPCRFAFRRRFDDSAMAVFIETSRTRSMNPHSKL